MNSNSSGSSRPRRPTLLGPVAVDSLVGGPDPAARIEAAHVTASALIGHARAGADDPELTARLVALCDDHGLEEVAELWADRPACSLPGALWRVYALRAGVRRDPAGMARAFDEGRHRAPVHEVVAGVGEPPGPAEVVELADAVLTGAFTGDLAVALERAAAFCRVVSTGLAVLADRFEERFDERVNGRFDERVNGRVNGRVSGGAGPLVGRAAALVRTAGELEEAARRWRLGELA